MAAMSESDLMLVVEEIIAKRRASEPGGAYTPEEWLILVTAIDQWSVDNASEFNQALPETARGELTTQQKTLYLLLVVARRYLVEATTAMADFHRAIVVEQIVSNNREAAPDRLTYAEWVEFVAAVDDWLVANAAEFNQALPQPFRADLTARQKAQYFMFTTRRRYLAGAYQASP